MSAAQPLRHTLALLAVLGAVGCNGVGAKDSGFVDVRSNAAYPYVSYLAGPGADATDVRIDLDTTNIRVGRGPIDAQRVRRATLTASEVEAGRAIFETSRVTHYETVSVPSSAGAAGAAGTGGILPEMEEAAGGNPDIDDNSPASSIVRSSDDTALVVSFPSPAKRKVFLSFPVAGVSDAQVTDMLAYCERLAASHAP